MINRQVATQMSGTRKKRVESMHDRAREREDKGEEAVAGGGVGKLVIT